MKSKCSIFLIAISILAIGVSASLEITNVEAIPQVYVDNWKDSYMVFVVGLWLHVIIPLSTFVSPFVTLYMDTSEFIQTLWMLPIFLGEFAIYLTMAVVSTFITHGEKQKNNQIESLIMKLGHLFLWLFFLGHVATYLITLYVPFYNTITNAVGR